MLPLRKILKHPATRDFIVQECSHQEMIHVDDNGDKTYVANEELKEIFDQHFISHFYADAQLIGYYIKVACKCVDASCVYSSDRKYLASSTLPILQQKGYPSTDTI